MSVSAAKRSSLAHSASSTPTSLPESGTKCESFVTSGFRARVTSATMPRSLSLHNMDRVSAPDLGDVIMLERRNRLPQAAHERIDISKPSVAVNLEPFGDAGTRSGQNNRVQALLWTWNAGIKNTLL